jgi:hypothetical protein
LNVSSATTVTNPIVHAIFTEAAVEEPKSAGPKITRRDPFDGSGNAVYPVAEERVFISWLND